MLKKFTNKKGFTLMELLIVVAIIAVLVAIAIPTFTSSLNKAKAGVDLANIRSGYANAQVLAITEGKATTYYLNKDGSVTETAAANKYETAGSSKNAPADSTVGGKFAVDTANESTTETTKVAWGEGQGVSYVVTLTDGVASVTKIQIG